MIYVITKYDFKCVYNWGYNRTTLQLSIQTYLCYKREVKAICNIVFNVQPTTLTFCSNFALTTFDYKTLNNKINIEF